MEFCGGGSMQDIYHSMLINDFKFNKTFLDNDIQYVLLARFLTQKFCVVLFDIWVR